MELEFQDINEKRYEKQKTKTVQSRSTKENIKTRLARVEGQPKEEIKYENEWKKKVD